MLDEPILRSKSILLNPDLKKVCKEDLSLLKLKMKCNQVEGEDISESLNGKDISCLLKHEKELIHDSCKVALVKVKRDRAKVKKNIHTFCCPPLPSI